MNVPELIRRKREGGKLNIDEIEFLVRGYLDGSIAEYQISAFLMAVFFRSMEPAEAAALTRVMIGSGKRYDLRSIPAIKTDKHSTGGVGDKISLILAPLVAAAGVVDPMVSGRGLGHTGGTLDKLDAIPGYRWNLGEDEFKGQLDKVGCAIIGQTDDFVPADKRIYALRDVTATVESIPLICASILSKKAASGAEALVMDVKCGSGAFMDDQAKARALAEQLVSIGTELGMKMCAQITQMNQPIGTAVGNAIEVAESIDVLKGSGPSDTRDLTIELGAAMAVMAGKADNMEHARTTLAQLLDNGKALAKFQEWIGAQGGNPAIVDDASLLKVSNQQDVFTAPRAGIIQSMQTRQIGVAANTLGAGRFKTTDKVDLTVGLQVHCKVGEAIEPGQPLVTILHNNARGLEECRRLLDQSITIGETPTQPLPLVLDTINQPG